MEKTVEVIEKSQTAEVRRVVSEMGRARGLEERDLARAELVATEVSTNLVKYGKRGLVAVSWFNEGGASGLQLVAVDHGPGFSDFAASARDGHSTGGSLGIGLGALMRSADLFDMYSVEAAGSAFLIRIAAGAGKTQPVPGSLLVGSRAMPKPGQDVSGDAWAFQRAGRWQRICLVDGLGHGPLAASASAEAIRVFRSAAEGDSTTDILNQAHLALKTTRGAVMAVMAIDTAAGVACYCGVGNLAGVIFGGAKNQHLASIEGTVGYAVRSLRPHEVPWTRESTLVLNSDGLTSRWNLARSPGLLARHPALVAAVLHRDFARELDDSTVVVAKASS